ncbi:response regulator [Oscillospiraceae bacterium 42-9]|uniref:response regulator n=1 Tax=Acutalibacter sp. TaxID=1918636 RepID=UPI00216BE88E|nr:response regulator [Acutalibacter sp.]
MQQQKRILVVDDDEMNLTRTRIILKKNYDVLLASSGMEALHILKTRKIDLVLLDIEMPKMNGFVTFQRMKEFVDEIPVIFLTASGLEGDVVSAIKLGAANYLKKPFQPQELLRRVALEFEKQ